MHIEHGVFMNFKYEDLETACDRFIETSKLEKYKTYYKDLPESETPKQCEFTNEDLKRIDGKLFIFVTWTGTDKYDNSLVSSLRSFRALKDYDMKYRLDKILQTDDGSVWDHIVNEEE